MTFEIVLTKEVRRDLEALDRVVAKRIIQKLLWWQKQRDPLTYAKRLRESAGGDIRFRMGDYRLIAVVNTTERRIEVVKVGHRRNIYL